MKTEQDIQVTAPIPYPRVTGAPPVIPPPTQPPKAGGRGPLIVGLSLFAALLLGGAAILYGITQKTEPLAPSALDVAGRSVTTITISWTAATSGADSYVVYRDAARVGTVQGRVTRFKDTDLVAGSRYEYAVATQIGSTESVRSATLTASTRPGSLAGARLDGAWTGKLKVTSESGYTTIGKGDTRTLNWFFSGRKLTGGSTAGTMTLKRSGATLSGKATSPTSQCFLKTVSATVKVKLSITRAAAVAGAWRATAIKGTLSNVAPRTVSGLYTCPGAQYKATFTATRN